MSKEHKRYIQQERMKVDKQQLKFNTIGNLAKPIGKVNNKKIDWDDIVYCPFCLYKDKLAKFSYSDSNGISTYKAKCPDCEHTMLMRTLKHMNGMNNDKVISYSKWCFMYSLSGFWDKVPFDKWKKRLEEYGWNITFWNTYKQLKGDRRSNYDEDD